MRNTFLTPLAAFALCVGCAAPRQATTPPASDAVEAAAASQKEAPKGKEKPAPKAGWSIGPDAAWELSSEDPEVGEEPSVVATFDTKGDGVAARTFVVAVKLTPEAAETFYEDMEEAATTRRNAKVLKTRNIKLGALKGFEVVELRKLERGTLAILAVAVSDGATGYLVTCGGNAGEAANVMTVCQPFVESFRVKGR